MAFSYGFYNYEASDVDPKLYDAEQVSQLFDGIITEGVYAHVGTCFAVYAPTGNVASTVIIGSGRAWFNHTWTYNSSNYILDGAYEKPSFYNRIDAVVIDVDKSSQNRHNSFAWVKGDEAETPTKPNIAHDSTHSQHVLAYVLRTPNDDNKITGNAITKVVGTEETPFVTGILESLSAEDLLADLEGDFESMADQWWNDFDSFMHGCENDFSNFYTNSQDAFHDLMRRSDDRVDNLIITKTASINNLIATKSTAFDQLLSNDSNAFDTWFNESKNDYTELINNDTRQFNNWFTDVRNQYSDMTIADQTRFNTWFNSIQGDYDEMISSDTIRFNTFLNSLQGDYDRIIAADQERFTTWFTSIQNDYTNLISRDTDRFETWFSGLQSIFNTFIATNQSRFDTWFSGLQTTFNNFISTNQATFDSWFSGIQTTFNNFISTNQATFDSWLSSIEEDYEELIATDRAAFDTWFAAAKKQFDDWFAQISEEFVGSATLTREGTASATSVSTQNLIINDSVRYEVSGSSYMQQTLTLSTTADTTYTFTNSKITTDSYIEVATDKNINYKSISVSSGTCSVIFAPAAPSQSMAVRIYIRNE